MKIKTLEQIIKNKSSKVEFAIVTNLQNGESQVFEPGKKLSGEFESFQKDAGFTKDDDPKLDGKWGPTTKAYYERQMAQCTFNNYLYTLPSTGTMIC